MIERLKTAVASLPRSARWSCGQFAMGYIAFMLSSLMLVAAFNRHQELRDRGFEAQCRRAHPEADTLGIKICIGHVVMGCDIAFAPVYRLGAKE